MVVKKKSGTNTLLSHSFMIRVDPEVYFNLPRELNFHFLSKKFAIIVAHPDLH